jgi:hypothetical protein
MDNLVRFILRFFLVPLGYLAAAIAGTLVVLAASWQLIDMAVGGHPDGPAYAVFGLAIGGPILLLVVLTYKPLPASIGISRTDPLALRSRIFHVLTAVASAWLGWQHYGSAAETSIPVDQPLVVVAAGIAGGFAYWAVAGFSAGFYRPVFRRAPPPSVPATTR